MVVVLCAFAGGAAVELSGVLGGLERETLGLRFDVRGAEPPGDVAVVAIDAETFDALGEQWPFPRSLHGRAIRRLHAAGAREIVYDVQFTEPTEPNEDLALYRAIAAAGGAVLATSESDGRGGTNVLGGDENLERVGARAAASDLLNDRTGAISGFQREVAGLESLAVVTAERVGRPVPAHAFDDASALIDYRGPPGTITTVSFSDVVRGEFPPAAVRGRVVVVGASAPTLRDVHPTPVGGRQLMAGAEVQANAIWTALHGLPLRDVPPPFGLLVLALPALVAPLAGRWLPAVATALVVVCAGALLLAGAQLAFEGGVVVGVVPGLVTLALGGVGTIAASAIAERRVRRAVTRDNDLLEAQVRERTSELWSTQLEIVHRLAVAVEWRDSETGVHVDRIGRLSERLALAIGLDSDDAELLRYASVLHDVGKVGIPDAILGKPGRLDAAEWATMATHPTIGASILAGSDSRLIQLARTVALTHHERWDGSGYPAGLAGDAIPLAGRIVAICDVFDALLSERPYKSPWPIDEVIAEIERERGAHFDPTLVDAFVPMARGLHRELFSPVADLAAAA
jgi:CHASE2 domain-containing sensor protein